MTILFAGGGTLGPVTPLLAVARALRRLDPSVSFAWAGTPQGPERALVETAGIPFFAVPVARITRYPSREWPLLPVRAWQAWCAAGRILDEVRPEVIATAGGYTGVPFVLRGRLRGVPSWVHQPDLRPVLSNVIAAPFAELVTTAWEQTRLPKAAGKTVVTGNPVRAGVADGSMARGRAAAGLDGSKPVVLVLGGGGGAQWINRAVAEQAERLRSAADIIHVTGAGKNEGWTDRPGYAVREFVVDEGELADLLAAADVVVARAGMGTLGELAAVRKPTVLVPIPGSSQEANAAAAEETGAALVARQEEGAGALADAVRALVADKRKQRALSERIGALLPLGAAERIAGLLLAL